MDKKAFEINDISVEKPDTVALKWSEVLESAFDYYYTEYIPAWTLSSTKLNNIGDKIYIAKRNQQWLSWENIKESDRPDVATLFDLLPDLLNAL